MNTTTRKWLSPLRWLQNAWLQFWIGMARRRNARLAIGKLELQTQLTDSPLSGFTCKKLRQLAKRHPKAAAGCQAEIKRRLYVGRHKDEIFLPKPKNRTSRTAAATAVLLMAFSLSANAAPDVSASNVPWSVTVQWTLGLLGFLAGASLVLCVILQLKKLLAKKPPVQEELVGIHKKIYAVNRDLQAEDEKLREHVDEQFRQLQIERARTLADLNEKISEIATAVAYIKGKLSNEE